MGISVYLISIRQEAFVQPSTAVALLCIASIGIFTCQSFLFSFSTDQGLVVYRCRASQWIVPNARRCSGVCHGLEWSPPSLEALRF
jgi:hypothetical protein